MHKGMIVKIAAALMVVFYTALSALLVFTPVFETTFSRPLRIIAAVVFFLYAIVRARRLLKK